MKSIAIIGGGPAGAMAAERLCGTAPEMRRQKFEVTVFEERLGWEKPCGGGLPAKALVRYPFLLDGTELFTRIKEAELVAASGEAVRFCLRAPLVIYSRAVLNRLLLDRAEATGARIVSDHISSFCRSGGGWNLKGRDGTYHADFLILAAGARSPLRSRLVHAFQPQDFMLTYGYYAPALDSLLRVQFFEDFEGYAWAFPRPDHLSLGIAGQVGENRMRDLRERLHMFMEKFGYSHPSAPVFSHLLPALRPGGWNSIEFAGDGWAIAGDAAGLVDPVTGEGIYFAMRSGELLAESLLEARPQQYPQRVRQEVGRRLTMASRLAPRFYHGQFLGKPSTTRLVEFCLRSRVFMDLLQDLFEGTQSYLGLPKRVYKTFAKGAFQIAAGGSQ